ncbi:hypothetical protein [Dysgonomonas reticulitermitis]
MNESDIRKNYDGDLVIQLFDDNDLIDQYTIDGREESQSKRADVLFTKSDAKTSYNSSYMDVVLLREKDLLDITQKKDLEIIVYPKDMKSSKPK